MAYFRKERDLESRLAEENARRDKNATQSRSAEVALAEAKASVERIALDGADDKQLDAALGKKRACEDKASALKVASVTIAATIADLEAEAAEIADRKLRAETAQAIEQITVDLEQAGTLFVEAATKLAAAAKRAADVVLDAGPLHAYGLNAASEVPPAVSMISHVLRSRVQATIAGQAPATLPKPAPEPPRPHLVAPPPAERVFTLKHLKLLDADGHLRCLPKMNFADLKPEHVARAIKRAWAVPVNDPRVKGLAGAYGHQIPPLHLCEDLDDASAAGAAPASKNTAPPIRHSAFEREVIGKPVIGTMSRPPPARSQWP